MKTRTDRAVRRPPPSSESAPVSRIHETWPQFIGGSEQPGRTSKMPRETCGSLTRTMTYWSRSGTTLTGSRPGATLRGMADRYGASESVLVHHWRRELPWGSPDFEVASNLARRSAQGGFRASIAKAFLSHADRRAVLAVLRAPVATVRLGVDEATRL